MRGEVLELTHNPSYSVTEIAGLQSPNANINTSAMATNDGSLFNSSRLGERNLVITTVIHGEIEANRIALYRFFKVKAWCKIYFKNSARDTFIEGYVESFECSAFELGQKAQISILCPQPYFKAMYEIITEFNAVFSQLKFELDLPYEGIVFSSVTNDVRKTVYNNGDAEAGITIELLASGRVVNPIIYNVLTGQSMRINMEMQPNDLITIQTDVGKKHITLLRGGVEMNLINNLDRNTTWLQLDVGENIFTYSCDYGFDFIVIDLHHRDLYGGV